MRNFLLKNKKILVLISIAVIFLIGMAIIQLALQKSKSFKDVPVVNVDKEEDTKKEKDQPTANQQKEVLLKPAGEGVELVRFFYDKAYDDEKLKNAMVYFEGVYRPNQGVDFSKKGETFNVTAAISGKVTKKTNDPLLGWVIAITNDTGVTTTYQSLKEVKVEKDAMVKQGDLIATSGENVYEADLKNHLHFVLEKDNKTCNPENFFNKDVTQIQVEKR